MRTFTDSKGTTWSLDLSVGHLLNIKTELGLNLLDNPEQLPDSLEKLVGILWITCQDQAQSDKIGPVDFAKRLSGDVLQVAVDKWMEEWGDFFVRLSPARGQLIKELWDKAKQMELAQAALIKTACLSTSIDWQGSVT